MTNYADQILFATSPDFKSLKASRFQRLAAGFIAGTISTTLTSPVASIKLFAQVGKGDLLECAKNIYSTGGVLGFWRGNGANCIRIGPYTAIKFFTFEELKHWCCKGETSSSIQNTVFGALSGLIAQVLTYPLDVIATRQALYPKKYGGIFSTGLQIIKEEGVTSLYTGLIPTLIGVMPYTGAQFFAYEYLKKKYFDYYGKNRGIPPFHHCILGATAGMFSQCVSYPLLVIKKRMMVPIKHQGPNPKGMIDTLKEIYYKEGISSFFNGMSIAIIKSIPYAALQFTLVEETRKFIERMNTMSDTDKKSNLQIQTI